MSFQKFLLFSLFLTTISAANVAQSPFGSAISTGASVGGSIQDKMRDKKKSKNIEAGIIRRDVAGKSLTLLRVPADKIVSPAKIDINSLQQELDKCLGQVQLGQTADLNSAKTFINAVQNGDPSWPLHYYTNELSFYEGQNKLVELAKQQRKDSLELVARKEEKRLADSVQSARLAAAEMARIKQQLERDSIAQASITAGYHFVNRPFLQLKEKALATSTDMGKLYLGTYVKIIDDLSSKDYVKVTVDGDLEGFVLKADLAENINEVKATSSELSRFKSGHYYKFEESPVYKAKREANEARIAAAEAKAMEAEERREAAREAQERKSASAQTYHTGPRGGCYYISGGNKVYVDKSYCK
jgi:hypothetical protein